MAHFSGQAGTTPRLARWAATRHGTITGDVEAEAAAPAARGGRRVRSSGTPRRRPARPKLQPPTAYLDRGSRSPIPAAAQGGRATEVRVGGVWRRRPAARGVVVVEAEAGDAWSRSCGGGGRRGGSSGAPRRKPARPDLRPPRCARSGEDSRRFGPAAARRFGERSKGRPPAAGSAGGGEEGGGRLDLQGERGRGRRWDGEGRLDREEQRVRVVSKTRVSDIYM
jgi:hypothetical protein